VRSVGIRQGDRADEHPEQRVVVLELGVPVDPDDDQPPGSEVAGTPNSPVSFRASSGYQQCRLPPLQDPPALGYSVFVVPPVSQATSRSLVSP
jgi:hypothetical protein